MALFVLERSGLRSPQDLAGVRAAWVDRQSVSGYLLIRAHLRGLGIMPERAFTSDRFFGSHEAVVRAVVEDSADVGATFIHLDERPGRQEQRILRAGWGDARSASSRTPGRSLRMWWPRARTSAPARRGWCKRPCCKAATPRCGQHRWR